MVLLAPRDLTLLDSTVLNTPLSIEATKASSDADAAPADDDDGVLIPVTIRLTDEEPVNRRLTDFPANNTRRLSVAVKPEVLVIPVRIDEIVS